MRVLVVGSGGREHAICRALSVATPPLEILAAPGNPGMAACATLCPEAPLDSMAKLAQWAAGQDVDLVVPGPELVLVAGLADALAQHGIPCCGPKRYPAQLEGSKRFTRELGMAVGTPAPRSDVVTRLETCRRQVETAARSWGSVPVVKADGLAAGKGVFLPESVEEAVIETEKLLKGALGPPGEVVLLEERLNGVEASLFFACHNEEAVALPHAQDHKRIGDGETGPNTGGMGAVSPNPVITADIEAQVRREVVEPILRHLAREGQGFVGFFYAGLMLTEQGPKLLEINVRLGDPEAQAVLPRLREGEFLRLCMATARGELAGFELQIDPRPTCAVVVASAGYPSSARKGDPIALDTSLESTDRWLDHAGTAVADGKLVTAGGRVAAVVARGHTCEEARRAAYDGVAGVGFQGMQYRRDIGGRSD